RWSRSCRCPGECRWAPWPSARRGQRTRPSSRWRFSPTSGPPCARPCIASAPKRPARSESRRSIERRKGSMNNPVPPGAAVGVLGSGQLGRMFAMAARRLGYRVHTFSPDRDTPTGQVADLEVAAPYDDLDAVRAFARQVAVVTFEFENVPAATVEAAAAQAPVRPAGRVLHVAQQRLREKGFLKEAGLPVARFVPVRSLDDLRRGLAAVGLPAVLKQAAWGYDGKGQAKLASAAEAETAWAAVGGQESILEAFVDFEREVSVVAGRGLDGSVADYGVIENVHR